MRQAPSQTDVQQVLWQARLVWAALLAGVLIAGGVMAGIALAGDGPNAQGAVPLLYIVNWALVGIGVPLGLFVRGQIFKSAWQGDVVMPGAYLQGNLVAWACCEAAAMLSWVTGLLAGTFWPYAMPGAAAVALLLMLWPNGRAMRPPDPHKSER